MEIKPFNWTCPYCDYPQTVVDENYDRGQIAIWNEGPLGKIGLSVVTVICSNPKCRELYLGVSLHKRRDQQVGDWDSVEKLQEWKLLPESTAKPQPAFIPKPIVDNYQQACRIRDLSPHASATMARRCLQGMIRDFCRIKKNTLGEEIDELRKQVDQGKAPKGVDPETVDGIDHVRSIGNIGAHMEKDIDLVIDVDPGEAQALINLIEILFKEWYVARETRANRLKALGVIADDKKAQKDQGKLVPPAKKSPGPAGEPAANNEVRLKKAPPERG